MTKRKPKIPTDGWTVDRKADNTVRVLRVTDLHPHEGSTHALIGEVLDGEKRIGRKLVVAAELFPVDQRVRAVARAIALMRQYKAAAERRIEAAKREVKDLDAAIAALMEPAPDGRLPLQDGMHDTTHDTWRA